MNQVGQCFSSYTVRALLISFLPGPILYMQSIYTELYKLRPYESNVIAYNIIEYIYPVAESRIWLKLIAEPRDIFHVLRSHLKNRVRHDKSVILRQEI